MTHTQSSAVHKISQLLFKELQQLTTSGKSFIKDSKGFVDNIKDEKLNEDKNIVNFDMKPLSKGEVLSEVERRIKESTLLPMFSSQF